MLRDIHQTKYSQLIPGINRNDEHVRFTHGEKCISQFGDGLPWPQKLMADATNAQQRGRHAKLWSEVLTNTAESGIADAYRSRDNKIRQWKEYLNKEVDSLAKEIEQTEECDRDVLMKMQYFADLARTSEMSANFRKGITGSDFSDGVDSHQRHEMETIRRADSEMNQCSKAVEECERKLKSARSALMSEVEAKAMTLNVNKRCQHAVPLLNVPHVPADHASDQLYHPNTEEDWERNLDEKIKNSQAVRQESSNTRCRTNAAIKDHLSYTAEAWHGTSKAIMESVQRDERSVYNTQALIKTIEENVHSTRQRIASLRDDLRMQDRGRHLQMWRLQTMTYRPGPDHIRDEPIKKLDEEVQNIERKNAFISESLDRNQSLLRDLGDEKNKQSVELERLTRKLFIERENCLGLRRSVTIEGTRLKDYVSLL